MEVALAAASIFQAIGQYTQGQAEKSAAKQEAAFGIASAEQKVALDAANAENDSLQRLRKLRQTIGQQLAGAGAAGVSVGSGTIGSLVADSSSQYARDVGISDFNMRSSSSAYLTSAQADANTLNFRGSMAAQSGMFNAIGTLAGGAYRYQQRGSVPKE